MYHQRQTNNIEIHKTKKLYKAERELQSNRKLQKLKFSAQIASQSVTNHLKHKLHYKSKLISNNIHKQSNIDSKSLE